MNPAPVASATLVEITRSDADGKVVERALLLDPRERSARVVKEDVALAWTKLPRPLQSMEALVNLLVDAHGFMRAAKLIPVEVGAVEAPTSPRTRPDAAWNWKGVTS